ncbi:hypothetical protein [Kitasatospora sp. NPDC087271]|uniref:restriction endonuclease-related protein n=1 Tax=Kitasatospora sp. NPDC087271 TaxID=3364067 RepID=UPI00382E428C
MAVYDAALGQQRMKILSAAIRAGYAWTVRHREPRAWREIMSMAGVVNALCPQQEILTPAEFVRSLSCPLGKLAPDVFDGDPLGQLTVLEWDELSDDVWSDGCTSVMELLQKGDRGRGWLPSWAWMRQEGVENEAFAGIREGANEHSYRARRRFVVENPAGGAGEILDLCAETGIDPPVLYVDLPADRVYGGRWWWACPKCRWPMRVDGHRVRCTYLYHQAHYTVRSEPLTGGRPQLLRRDSQVPRPPGARERRQQGPDRTVCVDFAVWRFIVVPGVEELALYRRWHGKPLLDVTLWPGLDIYDLEFAVESLGWTLSIDLKDVASATALAEKVRQKPLAANTIVLPDHRGPGQKAELQKLLPGYTVWLVEDVNKEISKQLARARRQTK